MPAMSPNMCSNSSLRAKGTLMKRITVQSSNVASIGYDSVKRILEVEFKGGAVYQYDGVPISQYEAIMVAPSVGRYLNDHIKGVYEYRRLG